MGVLLANDDEDAEFVHSVFLKLCKGRNDQVGDSSGIYIGPSETAVAQLCGASGELIKTSFPTNPSAFKRVATLLVYAVAYPPFKVRIRSQSGAWGYSTSREFFPEIARFLMDSIPLFFVVLFAHTDKGPVKLTGWPGFPSAMFEQEFLSFLTWLGNSDLAERDRQGIFDNVRLRRIALGTSLILEATYGPIIGEDGRLLASATV
jgi:hypothetical protein